jgi:DNA-binding SARP family transcriptional activator
VLEFRILGPFEVLRDGAPVALAGQKQRALLAALLLRREDVVSADRLVEDLWGDAPPRTAATSLQNFVSQLRKALGADVIETRSPGYRLRFQSDELDLTRFEGLVRAARAADPDARLRLLREALSLWRGRPLADFLYEPFAEGEIRRLEELRLGALEDRLEAEVALGAHAEAVGELEALVRDHPLRERLRGLLMLALYRSGRQAEALEAFQRARRALVDELGIEPSPELQRLHASILRQETTLDRASSHGSEADHYGRVVDAFAAGRLVIVLGPGVVPHDAPDPVELLAQRFGYPRQDRVPELTRVSQYVATMTGVGPLYDALHDLYEGVGPGEVHRLVASLAGESRARGLPNPLVVTAGYDLALERAFAEAGEEVDVVAYVAAGRDRGRFWHLAPGEGPRVIAIPNTYATELSLERRPVLLKLHGCVGTGPGRAWESFVVTEDDYIDYLARDDLANLIPVGLAAKLRRSHFLFLAYALRDWNLRVLLNRLWGDDGVGYRSWAVQPDAPPLEVEFWRRRDVDVFELPVDEYVRTLAERLVQARG